MPQKTAQIQTMAGKTVLITGANVGIGKATALELARLGARVILVCRDLAKGMAAQAEIVQMTGNSAIDLLQCDLASLADIRRLAGEVLTRYDRLDVLINNAAVIVQQRQVTPDGLELQFAVNHLAYFLLTNLLLDLLKGSPSARIINVASDAHYWARLDLDDLQAEKSAYKGTRIYQKTKLANILFTYELARRLQGSSVTVNCLHPGVIATKLVLDYTGLPYVLAAVSRFFFGSPEKGAETSIYLATSPAVASVSGQYFRRRRAVKSSSASYDPDIARRLWEISVQAVRL